MGEVLRNNCYLASASGDNTLKLWNTQNICLDSIEAVAITCIKTLTNNRIFVANAAGYIQIWSLHSLSLIQSFIAHDGAVNSIAVLEESGNLASAGDDKMIKIWSNNILLTTLEGHSSSVQCLCVFDSQTIISGSSGQDGEVKIWSIGDGNGECIRTLCSFAESITGLTKLDEEHFFSSDAGGIIMVWNVNDYKMIRLDTGSSVQCLKMMPNKLLASGHSDRTVKIWDVDRMEMIFTLEGHMNSVSCLEFLGENFLASGSTDGRIKMWRLDAATCIKTLESHKGLIVGLQLINPDIVPYVDNFFK